MRRAHGNRRRNAVCDSRAFDGLLVRRKPDIDGTARRRDIHRVAHGVFPVISEGVFIAGFRNQNGSLDLAFPDIHRARLDIEVLDGQPAHAVRSGQLHDRFPSVQGGGRIRGRNTVAGVPADRPDIPDLRSADLIHRLAENVDIFLDDRIFCYMGKTRQGTDADILFFIDPDPAELIHKINGNQLFPCAFSFPHLNEHVGSSRDHLRFRMLDPQLDGLLHRESFVQFLHIIHGLIPPSATGL